jgi:hypothetical protein
MAKRKAKRYKVTRTISFGQLKSPAQARSDAGRHGSQAASQLPGAAPGKNDDLVNMALEIRESIRGAYRLHEEQRPIMLFDVQEERLYAYPYLEYKGSLGERSQAILEKQYKEAQKKDQIVVFVRDDDTKRLVSLSIDYE